MRKTTVCRRKKKKKSRFKQGLYKGMWLDSGYELAYVLFCHDHNILIERNTQKFPYIYRGKKCNYIPDFVIDGNKWIEIKGRESARTFAKYKYFPYELTILRKNDLIDVFKYVLKKYGKDFHLLYEKQGRKRK